MTGDVLADLRYGPDAPPELRGSVPDYNRAEADRRLAHAARVFPPEVVDAVIACPLDGSCAHGREERRKVAALMAAGPRYRF